MKNLKHLLLITGLFIGIIHSASAQSVLSADQQEQVAENVQQFIHNLNLSERDKPDFRGIISDFFVGLAALRATDFSMKTNKKVMKALIKGRDSRAKELLSQDQYKVYKARAKERQSNIKNFMKQKR